MLCMNPCSIPNAVCTPTPQELLGATPQHWTVNNPWATLGMTKTQIFIILFLGGKIGLYSVMHSSHSWLSVQGLFMSVLRGPYSVPGIEPGLAACKAVALLLPNKNHSWSNKKNFNKIKFISVLMTFRFIISSQTTLSTIAWMSPNLHNLANGSSRLASAAPTHS